MKNRLLKRKNRQLTHKTNPNTSRTLYPISGIMKYEKSDFDIGCGFVEL